MKSRGGLGSSSSLGFIFSRSFLLRTAPHYLNAWNRLVFAPHEILLFPTADRRFDTKVKCPTGRASFWVKFPTVRNLTRVKCPRIVRGGMGGFGIDWYITGGGRLQKWNHKDLFREDVRTHLLYGK